MDVISALDELYSYAIDKAEEKGNPEYIVGCYNTVYLSITNWKKGDKPDEDGEYYVCAKTTNNDEPAIYIAHYFKSTWISVEGFTEIYGYANIVFPNFDIDKVAKKMVNESTPDTQVDPSISTQKS